MSERGFSMIEIILAMGILAFVTLGLATGIGAGHGNSLALERQVQLTGRAQEYLERLLAIPFGQPSDAKATGAELSELFDNDDDFGTATLHELRRFGPAEFTPPNSPLHGKWRVAVDEDLNGDGDTSDPDEGRDDLLRIAVYYDGRLVARTLRFDPTD